MYFSVTIPAYKSQFLKEAIESVDNQTFTDWELIIVDDSSPEDLVSVVRPFLDDKRIHYFRNEKNCGAIDVVDNWDICLNHCTGDYVICIGDDDRLLPCCLEEYKRLIEKYPGLNVYHTRTEIINEKGDVIDIQEQRPEWESVLSLIWNRWDNRNKQFIGDFCYDARYLKAVGGYYKLPLAWGSDDITAVMAAQSKGIANTQQFCFQYRASNITITNSRTYAKIKLEATLKEYDWYAAFLDSQAAKTLNDADRTFLNTIQAPRYDYFMKSFGKDFIDGVRGNPFSIRWFVRKLTPLNYSFTIYARWYLSSIYHLIFK